MYCVSAPVASRSGTFIQEVKEDNPVIQPFFQKLSSYYSKKQLEEIC